MTGDAQHASAAILRRAAVRVSFAAFVNDGRHGAQCFYVVDNRGAAIQSHDRGEGRLDARVAALPFERLHQRRFLAAFICARAGVSQQIKVKTGAQNVFAQVAGGISFGDGGVHNVQHVAVFAANVDEALMRVDGATGNDHAFNQLVRVHLHQRPVLAGARLAFIRVAKHVLCFRRILWHERPLHSRWEACATTSAQV